MKTAQATEGDTQMTSEDTLAKRLKEELAKQHLNAVAGVLDARAQQLREMAKSLERQAETIRASLA
jgi:hypothetical protein